MHPRTEQPVKAGFRYLYIWYPSDWRHATFMCMHMLQCDSSHNTITQSISETNIKKYLEPHRQHVKNIFKNWLYELFSITHSQLFCEQQAAEPCGKVWLIIIVGSRTNRNLRATICLNASSHRTTHKKVILNICIYGTQVTKRMQLIWMQSNEKFLFRPLNESLCRDFFYFSTSLCR